MIAWVCQKKGITHLIGFDRSMMKIADLVENNNEWILTLHDRTFRVQGNGCADPLTYVERIIDPPSQRYLYHPPLQFLFYQAPNGRSWEVWSE